MMRKKEMVNDLYIPVFSMEESVYVFGTGYLAKQTFIELISYGVKVLGFIERKNAFHDNKVFGLPVYEEDEIKDKAIKVIVASLSWEEIAERLYRKGFINLYVDRRRYLDIGIHDNCLSSIGKYELKKEVLYVCCPGGVGDTIIVAGFAGTLKREYKREKICLILWESQASVIHFFDEVDEVIASSEIVMCLENFSSGTQTWKLDNYVYGHYKKTRCWLSSLDFREPCANMIESYKRDILDISGESTLSKATVEKPLTLRKQLDKRDIILMPYANTCPMLPMDFWEELANRLFEKGYHLYTNVSGGFQEAVLGSDIISENIYDTVVLSEEARCVISLRSGICDALAFSSAALAVVNTSERYYPFWDVKNISDRNTIINVDAINADADKEKRENIISSICLWVECL